MDEDRVEQSGKDEGKDQRIPDAPLQEHILGKAEERDGDQKTDIFPDHQQNDDAGQQQSEDPQAAKAATISVARTKETSFFSFMIPSPFINVFL